MPLRKEEIDRIEREAIDIMNSTPMDAQLSHAENRLKDIIAGAKSEAEKANELVEALVKYGNHLPSCNINQDWLETDQAMADTPDKFRDEGYYEALQEIEQKKKTCTCGFQTAISNYKK